MGNECKSLYPSFPFIGRRFVSAVARFTVAKIKYASLLTKKRGRPIKQENTLENGPARVHTISCRYERYLSEWILKPWSFGKGRDVRISKSQKASRQKLPQGFRSQCSDLLNPEKYPLATRTLHRAQNIPLFHSCKSSFFTSLYRSYKVISPNTLF